MSGQPVFIVLEGADGCGKSTVGKLLAKKLSATFMETPPVKIRKARKAVDALYQGRGLAAQLFYASAVAYASARAKELLAAGKSVVVVRYWASTVAYNGIVRKSPMDDAAWIKHIAVPDFTCLLEASAAARDEWMGKRGERNETDKISLAKNAELEESYRRALCKHKGRAGRVLHVANDGTPKECVARILKKMAG